MIDNVMLVITGVLHNRDTSELLEKCHPLGIFDAMATLCVATSSSELYRMVLVDTPLGPVRCMPAPRLGVVIDLPTCMLCGQINQLVRYGRCGPTRLVQDRTPDSELAWRCDVFSHLMGARSCPQYFGDCLSLEDLDEVNIEIIRNTLYKAYIEDFHSICQKLGGSTAEVMGNILQLEADRRTINITINSIDTDLDIKQREKLYPTIGLLYPEGTARLAKAIDIESIRTAIDAFPVRAPLIKSLHTPQVHRLQRD